MSPFCEMSHGLSVRTLAVLGWRKTSQQDDLRRTCSDCRIPCNDLSIKCEAILHAQRSAEILPVIAPDTGQTISKGHESAVPARRELQPVVTVACVQPC
eukprot:6186115-Pleurochrysis_carterae.AAC.3